MVYKEIVQKIIDILKAHADLAYPDKIKEYHFGAPITFAKVRYPTIYVQFNSRRGTGKADFSMKQFAVSISGLMTAGFANYPHDDNDDDEPERNDSGPDGGV